ncbi:MAG: hypothetical protein QG567_2019 [Campylobacterota bacterium]|nr:hypothetical protein [Campylobacterota bacterium]
MAKKVVVSEKPVSKIIESAADVGRIIKYVRTSNGLSIAEAAKLCNISHITFADLEKGKGDVKFSTVWHICHMFGLKITFI